MAAPKFSPVAPTEEPRAYSSPDHVPGAWMPDRAAELDVQPAGPRLGAPGPDQGFALKIANRLRPKLQLQAGEHEDDVVRGCLGVALRRASLFSRAPVVHDLTIAYTVWGFYTDTPPAELVELRGQMFAGVRHVGHHYTEARMIADLVPESTLKMMPDAVAAQFPSGWRDLLGL